MTRPLQSTPFQNPGGSPERDVGLRTKEILVSNICRIVTVFTNPRIGLRVFNTLRLEPLDVNRSRTRAM